MLHGRKRFSSSEPNVSHVAYVKNADASAHCHVLSDNSAANRSGIFNRHVPAIEFDHLCAQLAVDRIERGFANGGCGFDRGQMASVFGWKTYEANMRKAGVQPLANTKAKLRNKKSDQDSS